MSAPKALPRAEVGREGRAEVQAEVVDRRDVTPELFVLRLRPDMPYTFAPGQYCTIGVDGTERPYSIVSAPHEPWLELFVELVPAGGLTPRLRRLRRGDVVSLRPRPKGVFTLAPGRVSHLMVATVTGIAPFVSMLRDAFHRGAPGLRFVVLHGASHRDEFAYHEELGALAERHPEHVTYIPTVSRPAAHPNRGWRGATGRVDTIVEASVERLALTPADTVVYACGHPGMIAHVVARLTPRGFTVKQERYWA